MMKSIGPYYTGHQPSPDPLEQYLRGIDAFEFEGIVQTAIDPNKVSPDDFALPAHNCMYQFWLDNKGEVDLPPSTAINPLSFKGAVGFVHLVEPNADFTDFKYRVYATSVATLAGLDMAGKWFSESEIGNRSYYRRQLAAAAKMRLPIYSENNASYDVSLIIKWCRLLLPLQGADGVVDRILVAIVGVDRDDPV